MNARHDHPRTSDDREACDGTNRFAAVREVDHDQVIGNCASCHDGRSALGKSVAHIRSADTCDDCHRTARFVPVSRVDHNAVFGTCVSCHDGTIARGKHSGHIQSGNNCDDCHTTTRWSSATFNHDSITGSCGTCHDGSTATGKPGNHFITSLQCDSCHGTDRWIPISFTHSSPTYPGDHSGSLSCNACHAGNSQTINWTFGAYRPDCAGCHADDYKPGPHTKTDTPKTLYSVSELRNCTGACHVYTDTTLTQILKTRNNKHRVNGGGW